MPAIKTFIIDAFTSKPFRGNPAAVCLLEKQELSEGDMQKIAAEMNLSETAFVKTLDDTSIVEARHFGLRWFTPTTEVPLCGHATLASAHALFTEIGNGNETLEFDSLSGKLLASKKDRSIVLDFPLNPPEKIDPAGVKEILDVVGMDIQEVWYSPTMKKLMVRISDRYELEALQSMPLLPSDKLLNATTDYPIRGVYVTLKGKGEFDFYSRLFAPWVGIPEDPVTGSAHTVLGPYWSKELGKNVLNAFQCSPRGGEMIVTVREDGRVDLAGLAVTVLHGEMQL